MGGAPVPPRRRWVESFYRRAQIMIDRGISFLTRELWAERNLTGLGSRRLFRATVLFRHAENDVGVALAGCAERPKPGDDRTIEPDPYPVHPGPWTAEHHYVVTSP
jgi:hypothetical protein